MRARSSPEAVKRGVADAGLEVGHTPRDHRSGRLVVHRIRHVRQIECRFVQFIQPDRAQASQTLRHVADQLRQKWPKLAAFIDDSETDVLSHLDFPEQHRTKLHSTNPLERLNKEVKRRADVVGIFPNEASIVRLIGAVLLEQNDEWQLQHRYMQVEAMAELLAPTNEAETRQIAA